MDNLASDSNAKTPIVFPKWMKVFVGLYILMIPASFYRQDWGSLCLYTGLLMSYWGATKEHQMSLPVKIVWGIVNFGLIILSGVLIFQRMHTRGR